MAYAELKISLKSLNPHISCQLCKGYLIDATTVNECLHTFCKSCLLKHLKQSNQCPSLSCPVVIHQRNCYSFDRTMQDIVYRLIPDLLQNERDRERNFYSERGLAFPGEAHGSATNKDKESSANSLDPSVGKMSNDHISSPDHSDRLHNPSYPETSQSNEKQYFEKLASPDDLYDLTIEYLPHRVSCSTVPIVKRMAFSRNDRPTNYSSEINCQKRYLRCTGRLRIYHIKKFLRLKYGIKGSSDIEIFYNNTPLLEESSIMDLAYFSVIEKKSLNLYFRISTI